MVTCMYCGKRIPKRQAHNPEDYGLHPELNDKYSCDTCNTLITIPNRMLSLLLTSDNKSAHLDLLKNYISQLTVE